MFQVTLSLQTEAEKKASTIQEVHLVEIVEQRSCTPSLSPSQTVLLH
jgi:hypothetical protein